MKKKESNIFLEQILKPSQMDICFSEKCNLNCDYCFVNKTSEDILDLPTIKNAVDTFFSLPNKEKTVTFTTSEPFLYPDMFIGSVKHIFEQAGKKGINISVIATTNGVLFTEKIRNFVAGLDDRFTLNFSLDGNMQSHDAHRRFKGNSKNSSFKKAIENFEKFHQRKNVRVICTITPETAKFVQKNLEFIFSKKFANIDVFPQMMAIWPKTNQAELQNGLINVVNDLNAGKIKGNLRLLNRLWGATHYAKILLGSDGKMYLFEWVLPLKYEQRSAYVIGDCKKINMAKREALFEFLFAEIEKKTGDRCASCSNRSFCANPLPLYLWSVHNSKDFDSYFDNFCQMAKSMIDASNKNKNKNKSDSYKWEKSRELARQINKC